MMFGMGLVELVLFVLAVLEPVWNRVWYSLRDGVRC